MTISPQIRILALVGLLAALGLGASMLVLGGSSGSQTKTQAVTTSAPATTHATTVATKPHVTPVKHATPAKPATAAKPAAATKHATKTHAAAKQQPAKPKSNVFRGNPVYSNLPQALQWELAHHKVVVVSVYNPHANVDAISVAEAHQGAVDAKVGFLLVNVLDNKVAGLLTALLPGGGLLPDPGVLVYRAPGDVALRIDGFADRDSVAQAALNALNGENGPVTAATTTPAVDPNAAAAAAAATASSSSSGTGSP